MIYLTEEDVQQFLPMRECIGLMRTAFEDLGSGKAINHPRRRLVLPTRAALNYMAAADGRYFGTKFYSTHAKHGAHFLFALYRAEDAEPLALMEANYLGQIRTGALSGLATGLLARRDSQTLGIIGSGFQARSQLEAIVAEVPVKRALVWSRSEEKREAFASECAVRSGISVVAVTSAEQVVTEADILVTVTNAGQPVFEPQWVRQGAHINAMGSNHPRRREIPAETVQAAGLIVVDSVEQSRMESGDLLLGLPEDGWSRLVEFTEVIAGRSGRKSASELTLFKSNGLALEDVAAAGYVYERAIQAGAGRTIYS